MAALSPNAPTFVPAAHNAFTDAAKMAQANTTPPMEFVTVSNKRKTDGLMWTKVVHTAHVFDDIREARDYVDMELGEWANKNGFTLQDYEPLYFIAESNNGQGRVNVLVDNVVVSNGVGMGALYKIIVVGKIATKELCEEIETVIQTAMIQYENDK